eukprot:2175142-Amphidinium_carterae.1
MCDPFAPCGGEWVRTFSAGYTAILAPFTGGEFESTLKQMSKHSSNISSSWRRVKKSQDCYKRSHLEGEVARVLVAHSRVRNIRETNGQVWVRPGGLGLIVMKEAQVALMGHLISGSILPSKRRWYLERNYQIKPEIKKSHYVQKIERAA